MHTFTGYEIKVFESMKYGLVLNNIILITIVIFYNGCTDNDCFSNGDEIFENSISFDTISNISLDNSFNVKLVQDTCNKIIVFADKNNIETIGFQQDGTWIRISNKLGCDFFRGKKSLPELEIHAKTLDTIVAKGYCNIVSPDTLRYKYFSILFYGELGACDILVKNRFVGLSCWTVAGTYKLSGSTVWTSLSVNGSSQLDASQCKTETVLVLSNTNQPTYIEAEDAIAADIISTGDILISAMPDSIIRLRQFSTGKLTVVSDISKIY